MEAIFMEKIKFWCFKILPLVYDDSLSYYEVLCKLREKLNELIDAVNNGFEELIPEALEDYMSTDEFKAWLQDYVSEYIETEAFDEEVRNIIQSYAKGFVNVDDFGAKGDGTTNDWDAFKDAAAAARQLGIPLTATGNKTYVLDNDGEQIIVTEDVNFNGATIKITGSVETQGIFNIFQESTKYNLTNNDFDKHRTFNSNLFNKTVEIHTPISLGKRQGFDNYMYYEHLAAVDAKGFFINGPMHPDLIVGSYECWVRDLYSKPITFENVTFEHTSNTISRIVKVQHNNVTVRNIIFKGESSLLGSNHTTLISCHDSYNIKIENIIGCVPYEATNTGYVVGLYECSDIVVYGLKSPAPSMAYHASLGVSFIQNAVFKNCTMNRMDTHYVAEGYVRIEDSTIETTNFCGGWGTYSYKNCVFNVSFKDNATYPITRRNDIRLPYSGIITFEDVYFDNKGGILDITWADPALDLTGLNCSKQYIIFNRCYTGPNMASYNAIRMRDWMEYASGQEHYAENMIVRFIDCNFNQTATTITGSTNYESLEFYRCYFETYVSINACPKNIKVYECKNNTTFYFSDNESSWKFRGNLIINNCILGAISGATNLNLLADSFIDFCNNILTEDNAFSFSAYPVKNLTNNVIVAETSEHEDEWNTGIDR